MFVVQRYQRATHLLRDGRIHGVGSTQAVLGSQCLLLLTERVI
jgi:hypothetical protein